jgi:hypothetical protein
MAFELLQVGSRRRVPEPDCVVAGRRRHQLAVRCRRVTLSMAVKGSRCRTAWSKRGG